MAPGTLLMPTHRTRISRIMVLSLGLVIASSAAFSPVHSNKCSKGNLRTVSLMAESTFKDFAMQVKIDQDVLKEELNNPDKPPLVGAIDQGTSSSRFLIFTQTAQVLGSAQIEHEQFFPDIHVGWHEHDALEIWHRTNACLAALIDALEKQGLDVLSIESSSTRESAPKRRLQAIGITNQRETTVAWNAQTGKPYHHAIVWDDVRTSGIAKELSKGRKGVNRFRAKTGLPLTAYFAGTKVKWLIDNVPELQEDLNDPVARDHVRFGTIDTWLMYQLTGEATTNRHEKSANVGGIHATDVSNASRWLFLDIHKVQWDTKLIRQICGRSDIPLTALPQVFPSSHIFGHVTATATNVPKLQGVPLAAILGDQQAALFGQCAHKPGDAKNTYGTGMFLMMNTGLKPVASNAGLLTTLAYQIGTDGPVNYALEGSVSHSGSTVRWLRDQLGVITEAKQVDELALSRTQQNDGLYFVPAFAGLFAPFWRSDARACIVGMTATHHKGHFCRAALEASAYQAREVFDAMYDDSKVAIRSLRVDGGGTQSRLLMQFQADMLEVPVEKPLVMETTALGAAFAAGLATGVWEDLEEIQSFWKVSETFTPQMSLIDRERNWHGWKKAVERSLGWVEPETTLAGTARRRTMFDLLRRRLNRARRRYAIRIQRVTRKQVLPFFRRKASQAWY